MSIRFPKWCKTRKQRAEHASKVARIGWERRRTPRPEPVWIGSITFRGPLSGGEDMRLDLFAEEGEQKWIGHGNGMPMTERLSVRKVLKLVRNVLKAPRFFGE